MRVLYVSSELYPLVKAGGLGDVSAALPPALRRVGVDVRLFLPGFPAFREGIEEQEPVVSLGAAFGAADVTVYRGRVPETGVPAYLLDAPELYDRPGGPYVDSQGQEWQDNPRRFALFGWAAARFADGDWRPDVIHAHDWHAGLTPAWLAAQTGRHPPSVFTVHNLAYQGLVPGERYHELGLPGYFFSVEGLEFHNRASFMKAGLYYADQITTVSPTYAAEIQHPEQGFGLHGLLATRADDLTGILNGVDYSVWDPATDRQMPVGYSVDDIAPKAEAKQALQREMGLAIAADRPLFGVVSRLNEHKGLDLALAAMPDLVEAGAQFMILGSGDTELEAGFQRCADAYPDHVAFFRGYDEGLAHRVFGGADSLLVPSRSEPCGLTQLYALRYGTLPLVRRAGGLADTVVDASPAALADGTATGFVFGPATVEAFREAVERAIGVYRDAASWRQMQHQAMTRDFGWEQSAATYRDLYQRLAPQA
jgi:starch synthase